MENGRKDASGGCAVLSVRGGRNHSTHVDFIFLFNFFRFHFLFVFSEKNDVLKKLGVNYLDRSGGSGGGGGGGDRRRPGLHITARHVQPPGLARPLVTKYTGEDLEKAAMKTKVFTTHNSTKPSQTCLKHPSRSLSIVFPPPFFSSSLLPPATQ